MNVRIGVPKESRRPWVNCPELRTVLHGWSIPKKMRYYAHQENLKRNLRDEESEWPFNESKTLKWVMVLSCRKN